MKTFQRAHVLALLVAGSVLWPAFGAAADAPLAKPASRPASAARASTADCERLWRDYRRSQACYERFRTAQGGLKPGAVARCGEPLTDPAGQCGPPTVPN
jgi:hypothetical protein